MSKQHIKKYAKHYFEISSLLSILFVLVLFSIFITIFVTDGNLPEILNSEAENASGSFNGVSVKNYLRKLTNIGPRIAGSYENEVLAVDFLINEIDQIKKNADPTHFIDVNIQVVSGAYDLDSSINSYSNVQNVVVKLHSKNSLRNALLVNVHFDSVPPSPGASDDGINCAIALEILRRLTKNKKTFKHDIIFLFNGAEETPLQASHGFITQHPWALDVSVLLNLEAAGSSGKMVLFQVDENQSWLLKYIKNMPRIRAQVMGEELFHLGFIPSDTDFRIFRDFGGRAGLDFALVENGYRYHTKYDSFALIEDGSYQYNGENVEFLVRNLADAEELDNISDSSDLPVYYDFMGAFLIQYSNLASLIVQWIVFILSHVISIKAVLNFQIGSVLYYFMAIGQVLGGWLLSTAFVLIIAVIIDATGYSLSWYGSPYMLLGLYIIPTMALSCAPTSLLNRFIFKRYKEKVDINIHAQVQLHIQRTIMAFIFLVAASFGFRSTYILLIPVIFQVFGFMVVLIINGCIQCKATVQKIWPVLILLCTLIPTVFLMYISQMFVKVFIPITGRVGPYKNVEVEICLIVLLLTILTTAVYTPFINFVRRPYLFFGSSILIFVIFLIITFTPAGFPYTVDQQSPKPQRIDVYHHYRKFRNASNVVYKEDAGYYVHKHDRNTLNTIESFISNPMVSVKEDCGNAIFCGLPLGRYDDEQPDLSIWMPTIEKPIFPKIGEVKLISRSVKRNAKNSITTLQFIAFGTTRMEIAISPKPTLNLLSINLINQRPRFKQVWNNRPVYVILHGSGKRNPPLHLSIEVETPTNWKDPVIDLALINRYVDSKINHNGILYEQFLNKFPEWVQLTDWLAMYESWVF